MSAPSNSRSANAYCSWSRSRISGMDRMPCISEFVPMTTTLTCWRTFNRPMNGPCKHPGQPAGRYHPVLIEFRADQCSMLNSQFLSGGNLELSIEHWSDLWMRNLNDQSVTRGLKPQRLHEIA